MATCAGSSLVTKQPFEVIPVDFRFEGTLGELEDELVITFVDSIFAVPTGDVNDLDFGSPLDWAVSGLTVQPIVSLGRSGIPYRATCRINTISTVTNKIYKFELDGTILVRDQ